MKKLRDHDKKHKIFKDKELATSAFHGLKFLQSKKAVFQSSLQLLLLRKLKIDFPVGAQVCTYKFSTI